MRSSPAEPGFAPQSRVLALYFRALSGRDCQIVAYDDDADLRQHPDTSTTLRLPARAPAAGPHGGSGAGPDGGFTAAQWYQVAVTHRAMHHALGTFDLRPDLDDPFFARLRPPAGPGDPPVPPLEGFIRLFGRTALAVDVFATLEDLRVDAVALRRFAGLAPAYRAVRAHALRERPDPAALPPRAAVAETLVRVSLGATAVAVPASLREQVAEVWSVAGVLADPRATVATTAEATIRVYNILAGLPNVGAVSGPARTVRAGGIPPGREPDAGGGAAAGIRPELRLEGDELLDVRVAEVRYRDVPGPRYLGQAASGMPLREAILRMTPLPDPAPGARSGPDAGPESDPDAATDADQDGFLARSLAAERGGVDVTAPEHPQPPPEPLPHDHGPDLDGGPGGSGGHGGHGGHETRAHGHLHPSGPGEYVYPEWDAVAGRYLAGWCLVRVRRPRARPAGRTRRRALARHGRLLPGLVAQLERVQPAGRAYLHRMPDGDDLDLDACVEAMIDLRAGARPDDRVHTAVSRRRRDVAVAFAIDLSSSTAERLAPDPDWPEEVLRILDVQRDAVTLLAEALERTGDPYGIYGFSGTGRTDVSLSVVKDLDERRSPAVAHRIDGLVPQHTTRMAPVIRHLAARLAATGAETRLLLVISDGRPFDLDYGQQYGEDAVLRYALADTGRALAEARGRGVRPYLITVDPAGGDYLGEICEPREYHVIGQPRDLPASLAELYVVARSGGGAGRLPGQI